MKQQEFEKLAYKDSGFGRACDCLDFCWSLNNLNETCLREYDSNDKLTICSKLKGEQCKYIQGATK